MYLAADITIGFVTKLLKIQTALLSACARVVTFHHDNHNENILETDLDTRTLGTQTESHFFPDKDKTITQVCEILKAVFKFVMKLILHEIGTTTIGYLTAFVAIGFRFCQSYKLRITHLANFSFDQ